jgi:ATP-dependent metalloprotease
LIPKEEGKDERAIKDSDPVKLEDLTNTYSWKEIEGSDKLRKWAERLQEALTKKRDIGYWDLVGKGVIIINNNYEYCSEMLKTVAKESGMHFVYIKSDNILSLLPAEKLEKFSPLIVYLEVGPWKQIPNEDLTINRKTELNDARQLVKDRLNNFNPLKPIIYVTSTNDLDKNISDDLKIAGLFDLYISVPKKPIDIIGKEFINELGQSICAPSFLNSILKIGHLVSSYDQDKKNLTLLTLKRLHFEEKRKIEYIDLANAELHSLIEEGIVVTKNKKKLLQTAYHEAGHALTMILEYEGVNVPDYTSILPGASGFGGVTDEKRDFLGVASILDLSTYLNFKRDIRVCLAGRAGEEVLVGSENVSNGATGDLRSAFDISWGYFSECGFAPSMETPSNSQSNLAIVKDLEDPSSSEKAHLENLIRHFLGEEYTIVRNKLIQNRKILDDIAQTLIRDPIVDQDELVKICKKYKLKVTKY